MVSDQIALDWQSESVDVHLNARWPREDYQSLFELARISSERLNLRSQIWVATSGSTAEKISGIKLVALSKQAFLNSARSVNLHLQSDSKDIWAQVLPLSHVGGIGVEARASLSGAKVVAALNDFKWDVQYFYDVLQKQKCTLSALVPTQIYDLVEKGLRSPPQMRAIVVGGGAFSKELYQKARGLGWPVLPSYGMTETCSQIATATLHSLQQKAYPQITLLSHAKVRTDPQGFLEVQASSLLTCYAQWKDDAALCWDPKKDGWFHAEDKVQIHTSGEDQSLEILGRTQDYVKIGGEAVLLSRLREKLEQVLLSQAPHLIRDFALIEMESERLGYEIHLIYNKSVSPPDVQKVRTSYDEIVLPFEKVRTSHRVDEIPRSDLGKILYAELKKKVKVT